MEVVVPEKIIKYDFIPDKNPEIKGYKKDKVIYAISEIYNPSFDQLDNGQKMKNISASKWKCDLTDNYRAILDFMEYDLKIIECDHHFKPGEMSMGYCIAPEWNSSPTTINIEDWVLNKKLKQKRNKEVYNTCSYLDKWVYGDSLSISITPEEYKRIYGSPKQNLSDPQLISDMRDICLLQNQTHTAIRDKTSGRYHSVVSRSSKRVRPYLRHKGEPLVEIDISCCQPFLSLMVLKPDFFRPNPNSDLICIDKFTKIDLFSYNNNIYKLFPFPLPPSSFPSIMIRKILKTAENKDVELYKDLVLNNKLYDWLAKLIEDHFCWKWSKEKIKDAFFYSFYSTKQMVKPPDEDPRYLDVKKLIYDELPNLFIIFNKFKVSNYKILPVLLQRIESYLIIDLITKSIPRSIPLYTIHDSILTTEEHVEYVKEKLIRDIQKYTGMRPIVKIKSL